jgi:DNA-binding transcriptional LysR family regulator
MQFIPIKESLVAPEGSIDFDLRQLEIFCRVVELGSFSKAANAVFLAQASVSERISTLEKMVGAKLLDRLRRQVVPTKAGELLYKHAVSLLSMKEKIRQEMENFLGIRQGEIHMGASTIPGEFILPKVIRDFNEEYPFVSVVLKISDTSEIERRALEGNLELGVIGSKSTHKTLLCQELWKDELVLVVPAQHRLAGKKEVPVTALLEEPFILREIGSGTLRHIERYLGNPHGQPLQVVARFGSSTAIKEGIKAGLGISILSSRAIETEVKAGILKALKVKALPMARSFYLIRDKRRVLSPLCQAMLDFLLGSTSFSTKH